MNSSLYQWLVEVEEALLRMIRGIYRFVVEGLPTWIYRFFVDTVGPVAARLCRVSGLALLWLMILFGPVTLACDWGLGGWWKFFSVAWVGVAILGSLWGLNRAAKGRNAGF
jgi:hypothetical protein